MMILMLTLFFLGAASMNAQVTIGSNKAPHSGAVLDLQSDNLGLKLPNVALDNDLTVFKLPITAPSTKEDAKGMYVYNTNSTIGEGVYVWDGGQWILVKASIGTVPVTSIRITPIIRDSVTLKLGESVQLQANIQPENASNQHVTWSISKGSNIARVDQNGLVTATATGIAWVRATAANGLHIDRDVLVYEPSTSANATTTIGGVQYYQLAYGTHMWTIENMRHVPSSGNYLTTYNGPGATPVSIGSIYETGVKAEGERGYYYDYAAALTVCEDPWRLPSLSELTEHNLVYYALWFDSSVNAIPSVTGGGWMENGKWSGWGRNNYMWLQGQKGAYFSLNYDAYASRDASYMYAVRCVRDR
ncbi:hypothetical protein FACS189437_02190 [Bacteroidia bacterium]|nr:hypothetical protein FACS189437_02190 [Bacteroidia bacterium]